MTKAIVYVPGDTLLVRAYSRVCLPRWNDKLAVT
jgi:hypothetical protein